MGKEEQYNIFNQSGGQPDKEKKGGVPPATRQEKVKNAGANVDPELLGMLKRLRFMDEDLKKKMEKICELTGLSRNEIERFIENPINFSESQWKNAQKEKELLEQKIYTAVGEHAKKQMLKKKKIKIAKERKGKTLGSRKGWIQM